MWYLVFLKNLVVSQLYVESRVKFRRVIRAHVVGSLLSDKYKKNKKSLKNARGFVRVVRYS